MRPYTEVQTPSVLESKVDANDLADSVFQYDLFAVVTHEGKLDNGHYWADVLSSGEWWHCDDDKGWSGSQPTRAGADDSNSYFSWSSIGPESVYALLRQEVIGIRPAGS
jgi:ubiquitin C-terminal hydrolase